MKSASLLVLLVITSKSILIPMTCLLLSPVGAQVIPTWFTFPSTSQPVNGSSATGHCTSATRLSDRYQCDDPTSSVVYDGHIPTLTGLDGNMWASQLLTINASSAVLVCDFTGTPNFLQVRRVEIVVFNCPQWGISVRSVALRNTRLTLLFDANPTLSSCDSLMRVIIPNFCTTFRQTELILEFTTLKPTDWIHIAEVVFYAPDHTGPLEMIINEPTTVYTTTTADTTASIETGKTTADTTTQAGPDNTMMSMAQSTDTTASMTQSTDTTASMTQSTDTSASMTQSTDTTASMTQSTDTTASMTQSTTDTSASMTQSTGGTTASMTKSPDGSTMSTTHSASCSTSTTLASVITAISTALLATLIFVLLQIALCKCHLKFTPGKPESAASAGGEELAVYEQVDKNEGYVAMRDATYMETGTGKVNVINLERNEAYGTNYKQVK